MTWVPSIGLLGNKYYNQMDEVSREIEKRIEVRLKHKILREMTHSDNNPKKQEYLNSLQPKTEPRQDIFDLEDHQPNHYLHQYSTFLPLIDHPHGHNLRWHPATPYGSPLSQSMPSREEWREGDTISEEEGVNSEEGEREENIQMCLEQCQAMINNIKLIPRNRKIYTYKREQNPIKTKKRLEPWKGLTPSNHPLSGNTSRNQYSISSPRWKQGPLLKKLTNLSTLDALEATNQVKAGFSKNHPQELSPLKEKSKVVQPEYDNIRGRFNQWTQDNSKTKQTEGTTYASTKGAQSSQNQATRPRKLSIQNREKERMSVDLPKEQSKKADSKNRNKQKQAIVGYLQKARASGNLLFQAIRNHNLNNWPKKTQVALNDNNSISGH